MDSGRRLKLAHPGRNCNWVTGGLHWLRTRKETKLASIAQKPAAFGRRLRHIVRMSAAASGEPSLSQMSA